MTSTPSELAAKIKAAKDIKEYWQELAELRQHDAERLSAELASLYERKDYVDHVDYNVMKEHFIRARERAEAAEKRAGRYREALIQINNSIQSDVYLTDAEKVIMETVRKALAEDGT